MNAATPVGLVRWLWCVQTHRRFHRLVEHRDVALMECKKCKWQFISRSTN